MREELSSSFIGRKPTASSVKNQTYQFMRLFNNYLKKTKYKQVFVKKKKRFEMQLNFKPKT